MGGNWAMQVIIQQKWNVLVSKAQVNLLLGRSSTVAAPFYPIILIHHQAQINGLFSSLNYHCYCWCWCWCPTVCDWCIRKENSIIVSTYSHTPDVVQCIVFVVIVSERNHYMENFNFLWHPPRIHAPTISTTLGIKINFLPLLCNVFCFALLCSSYSLGPDSGTYT